MTWLPSGKKMRVEYQLSFSSAMVLLRGVAKDEGQAKTLSVFCVSSMQLSRVSWLLPTMTSGAQTIVVSHVDIPKRLEGTTCKRRQIMSGYFRAS